MADNLASVVNVLFQTAGPPPARLDALLGMYAFAFQIYGDFAGYSLIARGLAKLLGFELRDNFRSPYLATDPSDFWNRWHVSLSEWLRDYLYIPLGGGRGGALAVRRNLLVTMLLGGLWHGAAWRFLIWGGLHGLLLAAYRPFRRRGEIAIDFISPPAIWLRRIALFHLVCVTWVFFRAETAPLAFAYLGALVSGPLVSSSTGDLLGVVVACCAPVFAYDLCRERAQGDDGIFDGRPGLAFAAVIAVLVALVYLVPDTRTPFLYFQF